MASTDSVAPSLHAWVDGSAGVAGDMLLAALLDAGADHGRVRQALAAVVPEVRLELSEVTRAGLRALKVDVLTPAEDHPHRAWGDVRSALERAELGERIRQDSLAAFARLAAAEAAVHGIPVEQVAFHEVGAWDSIADVVGVCAALDDLGVGAVSAGTLALGVGAVDTAHGQLPVPVPAVLELVRGWQVRSGGTGELTTPTGAALVTTLARSQGPLPVLTVTAAGTGAGTRDPHGRANVVRVVLGVPAPALPQAERMTLLETNIDDLDPRVWPSVLDALLAAGAADAWVTPIVMKKGRPAHTLHVLAAPPLRAALGELILRHTSTLGFREHEVCRTALERSWVPMPVDGQEVRVKLAIRDGRVVHASVEYDDAAKAAARLQRPVREVLELAAAAAVQAGLVPGAPASARAAPRSGDVT